MKDEKGKEKLSFVAKDKQDIESKLDEADRLAETVKERYTHEEVFDTLRKKIRK